MIVRRHYDNASQALSVVRFLWWEVHDGQPYLGDLEYVILPSQVLQQAEDRIGQIDLNGTQVLPQILATASPTDAP